MRVRFADRRDAAVLSAFGRRVFHKTFAADNTPGDLAAYLDNAYTEARQLAEIEDPDIETLLVDMDGGLAAFAQLRTGETPDVVDGPDPLELWRFYVDPGWHGKGVAAGLMTAVQASAVGRGGRTMWLGVWERNLRAQAFYRKQGFVEVGSHTFVVGSDPQRDLIMVRRL